MSTGDLEKMFRKNVSKNVSFRGCDCEVSGQRIVPAEALEKRRYLVKKTLCGF